MLYNPGSTCRFVTNHSVAHVLFLGCVWGFCGCTLIGEGVASSCSTTEAPPAVLSQTILLLMYCF